MTSYELLSIQEKFRTRLGYLEPGEVKAVLQRIYRDALASAIEACRENVENAFTICLDNVRNCTKGTVRDFLDDLL